MAKKHPGTCALCGKQFDKLSYEHIPPRAAFNHVPAKAINLADMLKDDNRLPWETDGLPYKNQQQGMGGYTLCQDCNSFTGAAYGAAYSSFAQTVHYILSQEIPPECTGFEIDGLYPQRIAKQVLSMFCSLNQQRSKGMESLRQLVLDKAAVGINRDEFKLCMYLTRSLTRKHAPMMGQCYASNRGMEMVMVSEIAGYPFGFLLYFNPNEISHYDGIDITHFADYEYDTVAKIAIPLCLKEVNGVFPADFRTREEIERCANSSE